MACVVCVCPIPTCGSHTVSIVVLVGVSFARFVNILHMNGGVRACIPHVLYWIIIIFYCTTLVCMNELQMQIPIGMVSWIGGWEYARVRALTTHFVIWLINYKYFVMLNARHTYASLGIYVSLTACISESILQKIFFFWVGRTFFQQKNEITRTINLR